MMLKMWRFIVNLNGGEVPSSLTSLSASPRGESTNEDLNAPHVLICRMLDLIHLARRGLFLVDNRVRKDTERCLSQCLSSFVRVTLPGSM